MLPSGISFLFRVEDVFRIVDVFYLTEKFYNALAVHFLKPGPADKAIVVLAAKAAPVLKHKVIYFFHAWLKLSAFVGIF